MKHSLKKEKELILMMNRVVLVGRLTKDPDLRYTPNGVPVATFTLAVNRPFSSQAGEREADIINCVFWRKTAENVANFLKKGSLAGVDGRIQTRNYEGQDGKRVYVTEVQAESVQFLEPKNASSGGGRSDNDVSKMMNQDLANQLSTNLPGLKVTLKEVPFEQRLELDTAMDYDMQFAGWGPDFLDPYTFMNLWLTDGGNNQMGYSNPEYDKLVNETATTLALDPEARIDNFLKAEKVLFEDAAIAPVYQRAGALLVSPKVQGVFTNLFGATYEYKWASVGAEE
jgi:single stranded DNA-binding protein